MAQATDYELANQSGASFRSELNTILAAIASANSGATEPTTMYPYMLWADTSSGFLKQRNAANNAWITLYALATAQAAAIADGTVTTAKITNANVTNAKLAFDGGAFGFRNKIIGGDFTTNPWQRGTSFAAIANASYSADRWIYNSNSGVNTLTKTADAPTAEQAGVFTQHCLHLDVTTADVSIAAGDLCTISQRIEGFNAASFGFGQTGTRYVTLSFWHKHTKTGTYCVAFRSGDGGRSYVAEYTQDVTDTWEKETINIPVDTTGTWLYDSNTGLDLRFTLVSGTNFHTTANTWNTGAFLATANQVNALDSTSNNFKIALVQLEAGQTATPFETRSYGQELALCQRYYYRITGGVGSRLGIGHNNLTTSAVITTTFPVSMRIAPTALEQSGTATDYDVQHANTATVCSVVPNFSSANSFIATSGFTVASGLTAGQGSNGRLANANGYLAWSAEL